MKINFSQTGTKQRDFEKKRLAYLEHNAACSRDFIEILTKPLSLKFPIYHFYADTGNESGLTKEEEEARMRFNAWATLILELLA